jgi:DNA-binding NarL/FixJ family response regulator
MKRRLCEGCEGPIPLASRRDKRFCARQCRYAAQRQLPCERCGGVRGPSGWCRTCITDRRCLVADLTSSGESARAIAERTGYTERTICRDRAHLRRRRSA